MEVITAVMVERCKLRSAQIAGLDSLDVVALLRWAERHWPRVEVWVELLQLLDDVVCGVLLLEFACGCGRDIAVGNQATKSNKLTEHSKL